MDLGSKIGVSIEMIDEKSWNYGYDYLQWVMCYVVVVY